MENNYEGAVLSLLNPCWLAFYVLLLAKIAQNIEREMNETLQTKYGLLNATAETQAWNLLQTQVRKFSVPQLINTGILKYARCIEKENPMYKL